MTQSTSLDDLPVPENAISSQETGEKKQEREEHQDETINELSPRDTTTGDRTCNLNIVKKYALIIRFVLLVLFIPLCIAIIVLSSTDIEISLASKFEVEVKLYQSNQYACPDEWIGFQDNYYYFSNHEGNWTSSRNYCLDEHADLTVIDNTTHMMSFIRKYKGTSDHWIGLKMEGNQVGKWVNGTKFNNSLTVRGNETCAYLNDVGVATARCYTERNFICRKKKRH